MTTAPNAEPVKTECPMCKNRSMSKHCASTTCRWGRCSGITCQTTLDFSRGIGYCLDPRRLIEKATQKVRWLRLIHVRDGVRNGWFERDIVGD